MDRSKYDPAGPKKMRCLSCGAVVNTNALARAAHERGNQHTYGRCRGKAFAGHGDCELARGHQERGQPWCVDNRGRRWLSEEGKEAPAPATTEGR